MKEALRLLGVHVRTIQKWDKQGKFRCVRTIGGKRRIPESEIKRTLGIHEKRKAIGYARVSSHTQRDDLERLWEKYRRRERSVCRDVERKTAIRTVNTFPNAIHIFEDLNKQKMISKNKNKNLRKRIARVSWINIIKEIGYRAVTGRANPYLTSKACSRCGYVNYVNRDLRGQVFECPKCGLVINRHRNASINIYLKMRGFPPSPGIFFHLVLRPLIRLMKRRKMLMRRGVTQIGDETGDTLSDERRAEVDVSQGLHRPIETYVSRTPLTLLNNIYYFRQV